MATLDDGLLRKLADWSTDGVPITSLHLDVDGRRAVNRGDYLTRLEPLLKGVDVERWDRERRASVGQDLERIRRYVRGDFDRRGVRGLAVFSASRAGLWETVQVARPLRDRIEVGSRPSLLPLEVILESLETFCVALVDRERARLFLVEGDRAEELTELEDDVPGRHDQGGWSQSRYQRHIEEHVHRHLKRTARVLRAAQRRRPFDHLVLGGAEELLAELERELHDYVARRIVDRAHLPISASAAAVVAHCRELEREREARRETEALSRLVSEVEARTGRAVGGLPDTLAALEAGRVETLVVDAAFQAQGVRCPACGHLDLSGERCAACGAETVPVERLEEETVEEALRRRCRVETVAAAPSLDTLGRIGALLRF